MSFSIDICFRAIFRRKLKVRSPYPREDTPSNVCCLCLPPCTCTCWLVVEAVQNSKKNKIIKMKFTAVLLALVGTASAFAPAANTKVGIFWMWSCSIPAGLGLGCRCKVVNDITWMSSGGYSKMKTGERLGFLCYTWTIVLCSAVYSSLEGHWVQHFFLSCFLTLTYPLPFVLGLQHCRSCQSRRLGRKYCTTQEL
jgi:hypothetical protein